MFALEEFKLNDQEDRKFFAANEIRMRLKEADAIQKRIVIDSVVLKQPAVHFEMEDSTNNILEYVERIVPASDDTVTVQSVPETEEEDTPLYYALNAFVIQDGID